MVGLIEERWNTYSIKEQCYLTSYLNKLFTSETVDFDKELIRMSAIADFHFATIS